MTKAGEILKAIHDVLMETDIIVDYGPPVIRHHLTYDEAMIISKRIWEKIAGFVYDISTD